MAATVCDGECWELGMGPERHQILAHPKALSDVPSRLTEKTPFCHLCIMQPKKSMNKYL